MLVSLGGEYGVLHKTKAAIVPFADRVPLGVISDQFPYRIFYPWL